MLAFIPTLALLATSVLAAPAAKSIQALPVTCQTANQASIVFRTLDAHTLKVLKTHDFPATFFLPLDWVSDTSNQNLVSDALTQGHSLGLAITTVTGLVKDCIEDACDHPVREDRLTRFLTAEAVGWAKAVPNAALKLVAFTNDVNVVVKAAKFLENHNKVEIVSMAKCLGHTVN
ncbi:hypothetical protein HDU98_002696 [Podochytrium sp. JEL0797]|nr:hypothetical protein HDU98_002696 [Podochytrium sp. JEL0797]